MPSRRVWISVAAAVVVVAAAGAFVFLDPFGADSPGVEAPTPRYTRVRQLVADLRQNGVDCTRLKLSTPEQTEEVGAQFGFCYIRNETVNIHVYEDPERVPQHVEANVSVRGDNPNYFTSLVHGSNWVVDSYSKTISRIVQEAIGGTIV